MGLLDGRVALITGAARGQGRAHAITCAREGADVVLVDVVRQLDTVPYSLATGQDLADTVAAVEKLGRSALAIEADVREQDALDEAVSRGIAELGHIDILIANAGIFTRNPFWEISEQQWQETVDVNLSGVWRAAKAVAPHMIERESGSIVMVSSMGGLEASATFAHYVATKHAVLGLMRTVALELAPYGIRCNAICPGAIRTGMTDNQQGWDMFAGHEGGTAEDMVEGGYHYHALKGASFLSPQVIADTALYLNSDLASSVTGATIPVDAGHMLLPKINPIPTR
jgi:SDR family mycofactocin-dependent oxidoreductase